MVRFGRIPFKIAQLVLNRTARPVQAVDTSLNKSVLRQSCASPKLRNRSVDGCEHDGKRRGRRRGIRE